MKDSGRPIPAARRDERDAGFTLIELLLVIIILGVLIGMGVPRLAGRSEQARRAAAQADVTSNLAVALDLYELDLGRYPTTDQGLQALVTAPSDPAASSRWNGPYLKGGVPRDPWGHDYVYRAASTPNGDYELLSVGKDGVEGNDDDVTIPRAGS